MLGPLACTNLQLRPEQPPSSCLQLSLPIVQFGVQNKTPASDWTVAVRERPYPANGFYRFNSGNQNQQPAPAKIVILPSKTNANAVGRLENRTVLFSCGESKRSGPLPPDAAGDGLSVGCSGFSATANRVRCREGPNAVAVKLLRVFWNSSRPQRNVSPARDPTTPVPGPVVWRSNIGKGRSTVASNSGRICNRFCNRSRRTTKYPRIPGLFRCRHPACHAGGCGFEPRRPR